MACLVKAKCPRCGSVEVENYALVNSAKNMHELEFEKVMVVCEKCGKFYYARIDGTMEAK